MHGQPTSLHCLLLRRVARLLFPALRVAGWAEPGDDDGDSSDPSDDAGRLAEPPPRAGQLYSTNKRTETDEVSRRQRGWEEDDRSSNAVTPLI